MKWAIGRERKGREGDGQKTEVGAGLTGLFGEILGTHLIAYWR